MMLRRLFSSSSARLVVKSQFPDVILPTVSLPDYIWGHTERFSEKVAIECGVTGRSYKYGELQKFSKKFSSSLRRLGLQPGNTLSIVMPNTAEWPFVLLGGIEAGLTVTTANPSYTAEELARQMKDCELHAIVTLTKLYPTVQQALTLAGKKLKPLVLIAPGLDSNTSIPEETIKLQEMLEHCDSTEVRFTGDIHDTAILPYSSGTTGLPKGVMLSHWSVVSNFVQTTEQSEICVSEPATDSHQEVLPTVLPFFHLYGMCVIMLGKMVHGVKLVTLPAFEPTSFYKLLENHKATILYVAPPLLLFLASHPGLKKEYLDSVRILVTGAAPLGKLDVERFMERAPNVKVLQAYGMTEASPVATHMIKSCKKYYSIGVPIPNTEMKTIDIVSGESLPPGEVGEVCIRGPQVMKGYFNRPDATKEIIRDGWLHTGDLGYYDEEKSFFVVDRLKEIIKVKGFQVAPAELEELLRNHPGIQDAAVVGVPDDRAGEVPKAYVVLKQEKLSPDEIQKYVAKKVSPHKQLKGGVEFIDSIPKNPSGKILRRKLREL